MHMMYTYISMHSRLCVVGWRHPLILGSEAVRSGARGPAHSRGLSGAPSRDTLTHESRHTDTRHSQASERTGRGVWHGSGHVSL